MRHTFLTCILNICSGKFHVTWRTLSVGSRSGGAHSQVVSSFCPTKWILKCSGKNCVTFESYHPKRSSASDLKRQQQEWLWSSGGCPSRPWATGVHGAGQSMAAPPTWTPEAAPGLEISATPICSLHRRQGSSPNGLQKSQLLSLSSKGWKGNLKQMKRGCFFVLVCMLGVRYRLSKRVSSMYRKPFCHPKPKPHHGPSWIGRRVALGSWGNNRTAVPKTGSIAVNGTIALSHCQLLELVHWLLCWGSVPRSIHFFGLPETMPRSKNLFTFPCMLHRFCFPNIPRCFDVISQHPQVHQFLSEPVYLVDNDI